MKHLFTPLTILLATVALCIGAAHTVTAQGAKAKQPVYDIVIYGDSSGAVV